MLTTTDKFDLASGEKFSVLPLVDDQGSIEIGNGTVDMDVKIFLGSTSEFVRFDVGNSNAVFACPVDFQGALTLNTTLTQSDTGRTVYKVNAVTTNTTLNTTHLGGIVTTRGADGAVVLTLPAVATSTGEWVTVINLADQNLTVAAPDEDMVALGDLTADSVAWSTSNEKIGAGATFVCDGSSWIAIPITTDDGTLVTTTTIASA